MNTSLIFELANFVALVAWALMIFTPRWKYTQVLVSSLIVPLILAVFYTILVVTNLGEISYDVSSLSQVRKLFDSDYMLLAGWIHYLAFDLLAGCWILQKSHRKNLPYYLTIPSLILTFILGPIGLLFFILSYLLKKRSWISFGDDD